MIAALRARYGAKWMVVALLLPPAAFGAWHFGSRAALVLGLSVAVCVVASILTRRLRGEPHRWLNPGSVITGLLLGLTLTADVPLYMVIVGALVAELPGKRRLGGRARNPFNPAALGRASVALLETLDPPLRLDAASGASVLFKDAGGHAAPSLLDAFLGTTAGAIGETSVLVLALVAVPMLALIAVKREASVAMLLTVPALVAALPPTAAIAGHAPWVMNPVYFLLGSAALLNATFFCTDPSTTPDTRLGGVAFGVGAATLGVLGRLYTAIPGAEMYGILVMNLATPGLDALARRLRLPSAAADAAEGFYDRPDGGRLEDIPRGPGLYLLGGGDPAESVRRALADPTAAMDAVRAAGVGGCGGAGYPTADKWAAALRHPAPRRLVVNAQEGEPETLKDRYLLQHHPARVAAGAAVAALVLGVERVDAVVDPAFPRGAEALAAAWRALSATSPLPELVIHRGPGLYVCGEETALIEFLSGRRGEPQPRPPYPTERGLDGRPTVVHNPETLAWASLAVERGPAASRAASAHRLVTLRGAVRRPGVYEVPLGTPLGQILALGGGLRSGATLGGFAVGGPSGGLLPPSFADVTLDAAALDAVGACLGTATVEVLSADGCVVREALRAACFFREASCGRCTPCRAGTVELERLWGDLARGAPLERGALDAVVQALRASSCGLGTAAATRVVSVLRHWPAAVRAHADGGRCEACHESS